MRFIVASISFFIYILSGSAQSVTATISKNSILLGDHVLLSLDVDAAHGVIQGVDLSELDKAEAIDIIQPGELKAVENSEHYEQQMLITSFDSGTHYVPEIAVIINYNGINDTVRSRPIPITVNTVPPDSLGLAPVKPIILEEVRWTDYLIYAIPLLVILLLPFMIWIWSKRKKDEEEIESVVPLDPADVEALNRLEQLEKDKAWESESIKAYESEVSIILRRYVERQFSFPALEWTTGEIIQYFNKNEALSFVPVTILQDVLTQSDMVKYAKSNPGIDALKSQLKKSKEFVFATKNFVLEEE